jgi:hypothetical protein
MGLKQQPTERLSPNPVGISFLEEGADCQSAWSASTGSTAVLRLAGR